MKKTCVAITCIFLFSQGLFAQKTAFFAGISASVNTAGITYQNNYGQEKLDYAGIQIAPFASVFGGVDFDKMNQLMLEVVLASYVSNYKDDISPHGTTQTYAKSVTLNYVSIPLLYRCVLASKKPEGSKFFVTIGPQLSFLTSAKLKHTIDETDVGFAQFVNWPGNPNGTVTAPASDKDLYNSTSFDAVVGVGGLFPLGKKGLKLSTELRGGYGLSDLNAKDWHLKGIKDNSVVDYKASHAYFGGLRIGLQYSFGKNK